MKPSASKSEPTDFHGRHIVNCCQLMEELNHLYQLCSQLDTECQHCKHVVSEWVKFGQHSSSIMQTELSDYGHKLLQLECQQAALLRENSELKELCLYLHARRETSSLIHIDAADGRDSGDGSSSSCSPTVDRHAQSSSIVRSNNVASTTKADLSQLPFDEMAEYVRFLERKVSHLERENLQLSSLHLHRKTPLGRSQSVHRDYRTFAVTAEPLTEGLQQKVTDSCLL